MTAKTSKQASPIYVIAAKEQFSAAGECQKLIDELLDPDQRQMSLLVQDAKDADIIETLDELRTLPFLAERRVVVLKNADSFVSANRPALEKYFDNPCTTGVLILTVSTWPANTKLAKKLTQTGKLISIAELKPWQLPKFIADYIKQNYSKHITSSAAQLLVEMTGDEIGRLSSEADKLATFAENKKNITDEDVSILAGQTRQINAFAVIDAMVIGDKAAAALKLRRLFEIDKNAEYTTVGAFAFHFRKMFTAKALLEKGLNQWQVEKKAGIWKNKDQFFAQLKKTPLKKIALILSKLAEADYQIKTGRRSAMTAIEELILKT